MDKLNYDTLTQVFETLNAPPFEVTNVDVKRLRDDRSEIQLGQEIAFVATASFRTSPKGVAALTTALKISDLAVGDEVLVIGTDAELRSDRLPIDEDSVALWLHHHYKFKFVLNGKHRDDDRDVFRPVGQIQVKTDSPAGHNATLALPWLTKLNTATVRDDYIDVDVKIEERPPPKELPAVAKIFAALPAVPVFGAAQKQDMVVRFEFDNDASLQVLAGETFVIPLHHDGTGLRLALTFSPTVPDPGPNPKPAEHPAQPAKSNKHP